MIKNILKSACIKEATSKHTATVIFSHGLGDSGEGWIDTMEEIQRRGNGHIKFICPTAPIQPVTLNGGYRMNSWYDIKSLSERGSEDQIDVEKSRDVIEALIKNEMDENKIPSERIIIGGFSQGAALSLYTFYTQKEIKLNAVIALSGYLPLAPKFNELMKDTVNREQPLLMFHGDMDQVVRIAWGKLSFDTLKNNGINGEFITIPGMGHTACAQEIDRIDKFIKQRLP